MKGSRTAEISCEEPLQFLYIWVTGRDGIWRVICLSRSYKPRLKMILELEVVPMSQLPREGILPQICSPVFKSLLWIETREFP